MSIARKLGILVVFGVPAIVGSGIVYAIFGSYISVVIFIVLLLSLAGGFISR